MTSLIEDVTVDFKEFWDLPILRGKTAYVKTSYDSTNALLLLDRLSEYGEHDDLAIVNPDDPTSTLLLIIESLLSLLKFDSLESSSKVLSTIKPGDTVGLVQGRNVIPGTYIGREDRDGELFYCVKTADGGTTKMPPELSKTKIQPYLGKTVSDKKRRQAVVYGKQLESLMSLPAGGLMAYQHSKALLVTSEKTKTVEALRGVTLGGDTIETIFPIANYTSISDRHHIGANALDREPILGIVSNTDLAVDIARKDPDVRLIIIDGAAKIRPHYSSIEWLNSGDVPRKIICLLKSSDEDEINALRGMGIDVWIWKRQDFENIAGLNPDSRDASDPFSIHNATLQNLGGPKPHIFIIETTSALETAIASAINSVRAISRQAGTDQDIGYALRWAVSLMQRMLQLPVSINSYYVSLNNGTDSSQQRIDNALKSFESMLRSSYGSKIPSSLKASFDGLARHLQSAYHEISSTNPKAEALQSLVTEYGREPVTIISCRPEYTLAIKAIYKHRNNVSVIDLRNVSKSPIKNVIVCGWLNRKSTAKYFLAPYHSVTFLFYKNESRSYDALLRNHPSSPDSVVDEKLRRLFKTTTAAEEVIESAAESEDTSDLDKLLAALDTQFGATSYNERLQRYENGQRVSAQRIIFEDGSYTYITDKTRLNRLDSTSQSPNVIKLENITINDELIFADSEKNLFDELLSIVKQSERYKSIVETADLWRRELQEYLQNTQTTEKQLLEQLALVGSRPGLGTLRSWINGGVISPSTKNLKAIVKVVNSQRLNNEYVSIVDACTALHSLHIQTGRLLVRKIISAAAQGDDIELDADTKKKVENYAQNARIVVVESVSESTIEVPIRAIGILFEP